MAVQLASRPRQFFCPRIPAEPTVSLDNSLFQSPSGTPRGSNTPTQGNTPPGSPRPARSKQEAQFNKSAGMSLSEAASSLSSSKPEDSVGSTSRPFLYSLLSSSPFSSLFNATSGGSLPTSTSVPNLTALAQSDHVEITAQNQRGVAAGKVQSGVDKSPPVDPLSVTDEGKVVAQDDGVGFLGLKMLSKLALGVGQTSSLRFRTKSLMDLPSLLSSSVGFQSNSTGASNPGSGTTTPQESVVFDRPDSADVQGDDFENPDTHESRRSFDVKGKAPEQQSLLGSTADDSPENEPQLSLGYLTLPLLRLAVLTYTATAQGDPSGATTPLSEASLPGDGGVLMGRTRIKSLGTTGDPEFLVNTLRTVFSSSEALNQSFLADDPSTANPSGLDVQSIRESYKLILDLKPREIFTMTFVNALEILLAKLQLNIKRLQTSSPRALRQILILLENPLLEDPSYHESLLKKLCLIVAGLKSRAKTILIHWFGKYDAEGFNRIVSVFQRYLINHFHPGLTKPDEGLIAAVKVLNLLYQGNEAAKPNRVLPISAFYNDILCRKLNFKDEYRTWKKTASHLDAPGKTQPSTSASSSKSNGAAITLAPSSAPLTPLTPSAPSFPILPSLSSASSSTLDFSYFNYPFLFDPVAKTRIMHIDAMVQMSQEFEDAFVHQALVIHAQRFLQDSPSVTNLENELRQATNPYLVLEVRRERLVQDVLDQIRKKEKDLKKPLKVKFVGGGEEGMDQGGVQKEFFQVLVGLLLDPAYGMFSYDEETRYCWINGASLESEKQFELVGIAIGLALYNGVILGLNFPRLVYKKLLDEDITLEDIKQAFPTLGKGLQMLLDWQDGDVADVFMRTFEISYDVYGTVKTFPLCDGGGDILVTNENRVRYVDLYIQHYVHDSVQRQFAAFRRGFWKVCGGRALRMCRAEELELLVTGAVTTELDFKELEAAAAYDDGYSPEHATIRMFWSVVHSLSLGQKKKLLMFVTASDRVPLKGLGQLTFVVQRNGPDTDRLPTALTCFGRLLLPEYSTLDKLQDRLVTAIENAKGFGLV
ncbi:hypothetical protein HK102_004154 [Quaeritorhiza haematococci]|nr:hypothetical protein HK102_004154 [Quaeritorhiza haematococci]